jgi:anaerobic selenocysteine-containing dehydrogenase
MIHEIINQPRHHFVRNHCVGFEELKAAARAYPADSVGARLWLDPEAIREAARLYATTKPACIIDGNGIDMQLQVFQITRAVCMLRALTGNLDMDGGDFIPSPSQEYPMQGKTAGRGSPVTQAYPLFNGFHETWGLHAQSCLVDAILDETPYPVRMLVVQSGNPVVTMTDANRVRKAFEKLDFLVVIDMFLNRTARYADVILPACGCFEKTQLNRASMRNSPVILQNQVIGWLGDSRPDWKIVFDLGRRLGFEAEFPWHSAEAAIDYQLAPSGLTVEMLRQNPDGLRAAPLEFEKYRTQGFTTPSGKGGVFLRASGKSRKPAGAFHGRRHRKSDQLCRYNRGRRLDRHQRGAHQPVHPHSISQDPGADEGGNRRNCRPAPGRRAPQKYCRRAMADRFLSRAYSREGQDLWMRCAQVSHGLPGVGKSIPDATSAT